MNYYNLECTSLQAMWPRLIFFSLFPSPGWMTCQPRKHWHVMKRRTSLVLKLGPNTSLSCKIASANLTSKMLYCLSSWQSLKLSLTNRSVVSLCVCVYVYVCRERNFSIPSFHTHISNGQVDAALGAEQIVEKLMDRNYRTWSWRKRLNRWMRLSLTWWNLAILAYSNVPSPFSPSLFRRCYISSRGGVEDGDRV